MQSLNSNLTIMIWIVEINNHGQTRGIINKEYLFQAA